MDQRFPYSPAELAKVKVVQFGIMSPDEIVRPSFCLRFIALVVNCSERT